MQLSPIIEAGILPINTVGAPGPIIGPPTWGIGGTAGVCMGHVCMSVSLDAGGMVFPHWSRVKVKIVSVWNHRLGSNALVRKFRLGQGLIDHNHGALYRGLARSRDLGGSVSLGDKTHLGGVVDVHSGYFDVCL